MSIKDAWLGFELTVLEVRLKSPEVLVSSSLVLWTHSLRVF